MLRLLARLALLAAGVLWANSAPAAGPDFTLELSPTMLAVVPGLSASATATTTSFGGFSGNVVFSVAGLPSGATAVFSESPIPVPVGTTASQLTISTTSSALPGIYPLVVTGTGGGITHTAGLSLTITPATNPDFSVSVIPSSISTAPGRSTSTTVASATTDGFIATIDYSVTGLPSGAIATISASTLPPPPGVTYWDLSISTSASVPFGLYPLTVTGTGGGLTRTASLSLIVAPPDFSLSVAPGAVTEIPGGLASTTLTTFFLNGFSQPISYSASGLPAGASATFTSLGSPFPEVELNDLTFLSSTSTPPGTYQVTVTGTGGGLTRTTTVSLTITNATFSVTVNPRVTNVTPGGTVSVGVATVATGGFNQPIALSVSGLPVGASASFVQSTTPAPLGTTIYTLTVSVAASTSLGSYPLTVTGTGGGLTRSAALGLSVAFPDLSISVSPTSLSAFVGSSAATTVTSTATGGFSAGVVLSVSGLPAGTTATFSSPTIPLPGTGTSGLTLKTTAVTPVGTYSLTVTGTGGGVTRSAALSFVVASVVSPDFTIALNPGSVSIPPGGSAAVGVTTVGSASFASAIAMSVTGLPSGITASFVPASIGSPGTGTAQLTLSAAGTAAVGTYSLSVTGTGGGLTRTSPLAFAVTVPDLTVSVGNPILSVDQGASSSVGVTTRALGGFSASVAFSVTGLPAGATATFAPASIAAPGAGTSQLTIRTASATPTGSYSLTVTATGGGLTRTIPMTLQVVRPTPATFTISLSPASISTPQGGSGSTSLTLEMGAGSTAEVTLSVSGLPAGATSAISGVPFPGPPGATYFALSITTTTSTPAGTYSVTVTGTGGGSTRTAPLSLTVTSGSTSTRLVPIVLDSAGVGTSRFSTELTLANRGTADATLTLSYRATAAFPEASGSGVVNETLPAGQQLILPDVVVWLRGKGLAIPTTGNQGGTLLVKFDGLSSSDSSFAGARTTTPSGTGRAGLSYSAARIEECFSTEAWIYGLRQDAVDRSNLALVNASATDDVTLRVTLFEGTGITSQYLPDNTLAPGQWMQLSKVLEPLGWATGYAKVERLSGTAPFYAYGVFNDNATNDGSYVPPVAAGGGAVETTLPALVETASFTSELVLTNGSDSAATATLSYVESRNPSLGEGGATSVVLGARGQRIIPDAIQYLRGKGVAVGARGSADFVGTLKVRFDVGGAPGVGFVGARTASPSLSGGQYGTFYTATQASDGATSEAWIFGLQQNSSVRSNLAVVNLGNLGTPASFKYEVFDGATGVLAATSETFTVGPGVWEQFQVGNVMSAAGVSNGYVRVVKTAGSDSFLAYGVINDGATSASGATNDGSFVAFSNR